VDLLLWLLVAPVLAAVWVDGDVPRSSRPRLSVSYQGDWTWISGDTLRVKEAIKALPMGFRWSGRREAWYATSRVPRDDLARLLPADVELEIREEGKVLPMRSGGGQEPARVESAGHRGDVVHVDTQSGASFSVQDVLRSPAIRFGASAPYFVASVRACRRGFADQAGVMVRIWAPHRDIWPTDSPLNPIAAQVAYRYADHYGLGLGTTSASAGIGSRKRLTTDWNPSSRSFGQGKMMVEAEMFYALAPGGVPWPYRDPDTGVECPPERRHTIVPYHEYSIEGLLPRWDAKRIASLGFQADPAARREER
jgi:hypothetical protein